MEGAPLVANQIDLFMHFLGASRDGLVVRRIDLDTISSSASLSLVPDYVVLVLIMCKGRHTWGLGLV